MCLGLTIVAVIKVIDWMTMDTIALISMNVSLKLLTAQTCNSARIHNQPQHMTVARNAKTRQGATLAPAMMVSNPKILTENLVEILMSAPQEHITAQGYSSVATSMAALSVNVLTTIPVYLKELLLAIAKMDFNCRMVKQIAKVSTMLN